MWTIYLKRLTAKPRVDGAGWSLGDCQRMPSLQMKRIRKRAESHDLGHRFTKLVREVPKEVVAINRIYGTILIWVP